MFIAKPLASIDNNSHNKKKYILPIYRYICIFIKRVYI